MRPRAARLAGLAAAAMLLALPGCKKAGSGDAGDGPAEPPARSVAGLLDYTARETARIVGASSDRPANLDRMLVAIGQPDPNALWLARLRTSAPFECRTQTATMVRCVAALSRVGEDGIVGHASVMMYDHDIAIADLLADRSRFDPPTTEQTVQTATVAMYNPASDGSYNGPYSTCRQAIGSSGNGAATCFTLIGSRTALWARLDPDPASAFPASTPSIRPNIVVAALDLAIKQLRTVEVAPDGSFSVGRLPVHGPKMAFTRAGWYARNRELFIKDLLFAGPYDDETTCQMDLPRANLAYQQFHRSARMTVEGCAYYDSTPVGL